LAGKPKIRRHNRFAICETNAVRALRKTVRRRSGFYPLRTKESPDISNLDRMFSGAGRRSSALLKIALFYGLLEVAGGISTLSLQIRIASRKFKRIAGNPRKSRNFADRAGSFRSSAELFNFQLEIRKFG